MSYRLSHAAIRHPAPAPFVEGERGFTLIELIVVTAILTIVSSLILANNNKFGGRILLENLAYDVALTIRESQVFGISVQRFGTNTFSAGYGMHFSKASPTTYVMFADIAPATPDGVYEVDQGELVQSTAIERGYFITDLCIRTPRATVETCGLDSLDILFRRPEPDAFISSNGASGVVNPAALQEGGRIILESPRGDRMSVLVELTGQISVE